MAFVGRLLQIYNQVRLLAKEASHADTITETNVLVLVNMCSNELAVRGAFKVKDLVDTTANDPDVDYPADCIEPIDAWWVATGERLARISTERQYEYLLACKESDSTVYGRFFTASVMKAWPTPTATATGAIKLLYKYLPEALDAADEAGCTPPTPLGHDWVYVAYCLKEIFATKRGLTKGESLFARWRAEYELEVARLIRQGMSK